MAPSKAAWPSSTSTPRTPCKRRRRATPPRPPSLDRPSEQRRAARAQYAFKCHRSTVDGADGVHPVNAVAFHPKHGTFATGGCDGIVNVWDAAHKKRLCQFRKYPTSIAALAFSPTGDAVAIAASYTFENGDQPHPADAIFVRRLTDADLRPKKPRLA